MTNFRELAGGALRRRRQAQARTLREVADAAGVSLAYLSEVERGRKEPSSEVLEAVAPPSGCCCRTRCSRSPIRSSGWRRRQPRRARRLHRHPGHPRRLRRPPRPVAAAPVPAAAAPEPVPAGVADLQAYAAARRSA